jgi:DNA-binding MarR family transcriptional regulator
VSSSNRPTGHAGDVLPGRFTWIVKEPDTVTDVSSRPPEVATDGAPWLSYLVKRVELAQRAGLEAALRSSGVTLPQYTALSILGRRGELSSAQLARRHYVTPQAMNQLVTVLERDGLIERSPDPANRRILRARLTPRGRKVLRQCNKSVGAVEQRMLAGLSERQVRDLRTVLERLLDALGRPSRASA